MAPFWARFCKFFTFLKKRKSRNMSILDSSHILLTRDPVYLQTYQNWRDQKCYSSHLQYILEQYSFFFHNKYTDPNVSFIQTPSISGIVLRNGIQEWNQETFLFLFDFLNELLKNEDYVSQVDDVKTNTYDWGTTRLERHYLKPKIQLNTEDLRIQLYGNIMMTLNFADDKVDMLKISLTQYHDKQFDKARSFESFLDFLKKQI